MLRLTAAEHPGDADPAERDPAPCPPRAAEARGTAAGLRAGLALITHLHREERGCSRS
jgi:hypothetical protein